MAACGARGSALLPFITCRMASNLRIENLLPQALPDFFFFFRRLLAIMIISGLDLVWGLCTKRRKMTLEDFRKEKKVLFMSQIMTTR